MTPNIPILELTDLAGQLPPLFVMFDNPDEAIANAAAKKQPAVYKLPKQNAWIVAVAK